MARFLITGSRAPVALELARNLVRFGHIVFLADSLRFPLARHSSSVSNSFYVTAPRDSLESYQLEIKAILKENKIDILVPMCEEVFYISAIKPDLEQYSTIFCPNFDLIKSLHSKSEIFSCIEGTGFLMPESEVIGLEELKQRDNFTGLVVKKEFCRFGTDVYIEPVNKSFTSSVNGNFILQEKIEGTEYCSYSISDNGKVSFVSLYEPRYKVKKSASIYFKPVFDTEIEQLIVNFCEKNHITGQLGFDVIKNDRGVYLLECNPRATSGLHLLSEMDLSKGFLEKYTFNSMRDQTMKSKMISLAMLIIALPVSIKNRYFKAWKKDYNNAEDVISVKDDKSIFLYSLISFVEIVFISIIKLRSLRASSTFDIEWDGEDLEN